MRLIGIREGSGGSPEGHAAGSSQATEDSPQLSHWRVVRKMRRMGAMALVGRRWFEGSRVGTVLERALIERCAIGACFRKLKIPWPGWLE